MSTPTTTEKNLSKAEEIRLIEKLAAGNGYFADWFTEADVEAMIKNIKNDFTLMLGTTDLNKQRDLESRCSELETEWNRLIVANERLKSELQEYEAENNLMTEKLKEILKSFVTHEWEQSPYELSYQFFPQAEVIKAKLINKVELEETETEWIINNLKS